MVSTDAGVKVFGNTDEFHLKWKKWGGLPGKIRLKSFLKSAEIVFNGDKVRKKHFL